MKTSALSHDKSIQENLDVFCYEVGSQFEKYSIKAANRFLQYIGKNPVVDLGSGDGAATKVFVANGNKVTAVDINPDKLSKITDAKTVQKDYVSFLSKPVDNVFLHHSLEHYVDSNKVLRLISKWLKPGCYCYIAVPRKGELYSVHHTVFESIAEIKPPGLKVVESLEDTDLTWPEYCVIARKNELE